VANRVGQQRGVALAAAVMHALHRRLLIGVAHAGLHLHDRRTVDRDRPERVAQVVESSGRSFASSSTRL
jgi:hypothetical protein